MCIELSEATTAAVYLMQALVDLLTYILTEMLVVAYSLFCCAYTCLIVNLMFAFNERYSVWSPLRINTSI